ncbi:hypothetical protein BDB01DRAFT_845484 [Pilobolus umbonatus]|nr:hypothetical protein BDB01DRAFT_845484 [Pilobolus umbonatus]
MKLEISEIYPGSLINGVVVDDIHFSIHDGTGRVDTAKLKSFCFDEVNKRTNLSAKFTQYRIDTEIDIRVSFNVLKNGYSDKRRKSIAQPTPNMSSVYNIPEFSDVKFIVSALPRDQIDDMHSISSQVMSTKVSQRNHRFKVFYAHKCILAACSSYFKRLVTVKMKESEESEIRLYEVDLNVFEKMLKFCYSFDITLDDYSDGCDILILNDYYEVSRLSEVVINKLVLILDYTNLFYIWDVAETHGYKTLAHSCQDLFVRSTPAIFNNKSWLSTEASIIERAFTLDCGLYLSEVDLYEAIVLWANHQQVNIPLDDMQKSFIDKGNGLYSNEDILKKDLADIMYHIRFPLMTIEYIESTIKTNEWIMAIEGMEDYLNDAHIYHSSNVCFSSKCVSRGRLMANSS